MSASVQLYGLILYALCSSVVSEDRVWLSNTPAPATPNPTSLTTVSPTSAPAQAQDELPEPVPADLPPLVPTESLADPAGPTESSKQGVNDFEKIVQAVLNIEQLKSENESTNATADEGKRKKPRIWMSISQEDPKPSEDDAEIPLNVTSETSSEDITDEDTLNQPEPELSMNISDTYDSAEDEILMVQETIWQLTTIYVTLTENLPDLEPLYVNLTGIRDFTGQERIVVGGCLDLSDLYITGEEAKEVIQRMSKYRFQRLDLRNNNITELPNNAFSPVAYSARELRLDSNPLRSNTGEGNMMHRGGLFHLTELRELNLSNCDLRDIDFFTPWNSNNLEVVDISCNNLHTVPSNLQFFHKLKKLFLDGNPITTISELPFALLWNMQVLSISSCHVSSITSDPFRNMERLKEVSLAGNNLTRISEVRLPRSSAGAKLYLSGNPWHCACEMLAFVEYHQYAIRDLEDIRCASPRWLKGLRTAYLTKEVLSLDSLDGECTPSMYDVVSTPVAHQRFKLRSDRLEALALAIFFLAVFLLVINVFWTNKKNKFMKCDDDRGDIKYIRFGEKPNFK